MKNRYRAYLGLVAMVLSLAALTAQTSTAAENKVARADNPCWVHLWDGGNFKDDNDIIYGPGRWGSLRNLSGASRANWGDEADSLKVGPKATVRVWNDADFKGTVFTYGPGTEQADLDEEPESLEIVCQ